VDDAEYVKRLVKVSDKPIKSILKFVNPYRFNLKKWVDGNCLEIGCGIGRNMGYLNNANNVGIDVNSAAVDYCRTRGHKAYSPNDFEQTWDRSQLFDCLLFSHVFEHMDYEQAKSLLGRYKTFLKSGGKVIVVCPQVRGFNSDPTHIEFMDFLKISRLALSENFTIKKMFSHPLPRIFSHIFIYNEFVLIAELTDNVAQ
jgi:SAM-dependent methyltransferase